ncbi:MAG: MFS transporter [Steroidobacteraceae bacterium]|jgi:MFS family permease|nr:MFS transporter [Steroidobacteraceae bacterium]
MRNVWILTLAQAFAACGTLTLFAFGGIVGTHIAPTPAVATLPLTCSIAGVALASLPVALLMQRTGRKPVLVGSALLAAAAALLCAWAIAHADFALLCAGGFLLGCNMSVVQQYRFAAAEFVAPEQAGRAVSTVMLGTLAAAIGAPTLGALASRLGGWPEFTGSFVVLSGLLVVAAGVLGLLGRTPVRAEPPRGAGRPLREILRQPAYRIAVTCGLVSYAVMSFIMTATPISMHVHDGFSGGETTSVISAHLLGMYLPSLATPLIVRTLGLRAMLYLGVAAMALCVGVSAFAGHAFVHYFSGLVLLGLGWNLMFVASTTLLTTTYASHERFRAQGFNDLAIFGSQATASLLAGTAMETLGWEALNLASVPLLLVALLALRALPATPAALPART